MSNAIEHFKNAVIVKCLNTGNEFLYNEEYCKYIWDFSNIQLGLPTVKLVQLVMGGVLFKEPRTYAEIIKTKEDCKKYIKEY